MKPVIYLTGPPAAGKSTLCRSLGERFTNLDIFSYSVVLRDVLRRKFPSLSSLSEDDLRRESAALITPELIDETDLALIERVSSLRKTAPVIIDSHPVTIESYGFRITPFKLEILRKLAPTHICMLYCTPEETQKRIRSNAQGRPIPTIFEAQFHIQLQSQVSCIYALDLGLTAYFFDTTERGERAYEMIASFISSSGAKP